MTQTNEPRKRGPKPLPDDQQTEVISIRLTRGEIAELQGHPIRCPTCSQRITAPNTIVRLAIRRMLGRIPSIEHADE